MSTTFTKGMLGKDFYKIYNFSSGRPYSELGSSDTFKVDILGRPKTMLEFFRGPTHGLLIASEDMDCHHEPLHSDEVVMDDLGQGH